MAQNTAKVSTLTAQTIIAAEQHLKTSCEIMAKLIAQYGRWQISRKNLTPFETLATSIISQQISVKAAATIEGRLRQLVNAVTPEIILTVAPENLRQVGLSAPKIRYLTALANMSIDGSLDFAAIKKLPDNEVIVQLTQVPGIGKWTAEMFLIFYLRRRDVLSLGDVGLQRAHQLLFGDTVSLQQSAENWTPYCSVASWYLWKSLDNKN